MQRFSFVSFFADEFAFDNHYASQLIQRIIAKDSACPFSPDDLIEDLKLSFSFWIDDSGTISFAHKSLQEYLCALYIHELDSAQKKLIYQKLLRKAGGLSDQYNILSILEEIDTSHYLTNYFIPVLVNLKELIEGTLFVSDFISCIFPSIWIMHDRTFRFIISPSVFRCLQILDKKKNLIRELHLALTDELNKSDDFFAAVPKKQKKQQPKHHQLDLQSAPAEVKSILNQNDKLRDLKEAFRAEVEQLISNANKQIETQQEMDNDILSMI
jgi:hypothetical protein